MLMSMRRHVAWAVWLILSALTGIVPAVAQSQQPPITPGPESRLPDAVGTATSSAEQQPDQNLSGSISGTIVDQTGAFVAGARVKLSREDQSSSQDVLSNDDGQFTFARIAPGSFQITITMAGFAPQTSSGVLRSGEAFTVPQITLTVATNTTEVRVVFSRVEEAEAEIKEQEKQRVLGFIPNFYVSYVHDAVPLTSKQKFELAWKMTVDPITFGVTGVIAGVQQSQDVFHDYGQGAQGYAKRYGASYGDLVTSTIIGSAVLPSLLKQDPRYFYKGTGSKRSRILYAIANSVICKGDNGHWQANYSAILGSLAAGGISNLYYPSRDRNDATLTVENTLIGIGETAVVNVLQEFFMRKLTRNAPNYQTATP
jgi:carboxypeptidase family protein